ncbi:diaminopimelate epimerase [Dietzia cinnamea]|uniref:diaminopimelate epimerase n=1 Tax=Dietzia cinnamea TaxID=321318 RepID=UPI000D61A17E|nr:diaminopimelate epimerase [Dietzia cinnamea]PWD95313.1 diaminopimelate epimerase [Dietzia maris]MBM7229041.1 diaminopimelate epimerase [Dietzia cinnamea]MCT1641289.1 diaminopimelate epimerase [Dietzia cinnamea]MCT2062059.1 diaminopimelate epimerase [Dietzia cinnamea]MCT2175750.1 diaminopimelate epimerase [Dietzia cinnamea]
MTPDHNTPTATDGIAFLKGHGTLNDFVILPDDHAELDLDETLVRALCDRRGGIGADGILRIATAGALVDRGVLPALPDGVDPADWFMDYRNADGSIAEMCGNGVRVFAHALVATHRADIGTIAIGTRSGPRPATIVSRSGDDAVVRVDMGEPRLLGLSSAELGGRTFAGVAVDMGNPHLACVVPGLDAAALAALPVADPPTFDRDFFPHGVNVEIATPLTGGRVTMRVHERGAGETMSCGTGIVATAVAALADAGRGSGDVVVAVPGGEVEVHLADGGSTLTGPSALVASGRFHGGAYHTPAYATHAAPM